MLETVQSLSQGFCGSLALEVFLAHCLKYDGCAWQEDVYRPQRSCIEIGRSHANHLAMVWIMGQEGPRELILGQPAISIVIIPLKHQLALVVGSADANQAETNLQFTGGDVPLPVHVEDAEGVDQVEVHFLGEAYFGAFEFYF